MNLVAYSKEEQLQLYIARDKTWTDVKL